MVGRLKVVQTLKPESGLVRVRGARQNNLKDIDLDIPRDAFVVFTGVSGSGKSSLAFGTIYAEAQKRYFETVAPYARRLLEQLPAPLVKELTGLPPAVALQQRRSDANSRSTVGTLTTLANSMRMLFSRAGTYPKGFVGRLDSDAFSANTPAGACPACHGIGIIHSVSERSLVPNPELSIRDRAIAAWPGAWQGKNYRDILATLGYDIDRPFKDLSEADRQWILFTDEQPVVTVYAEREAHRIQRPYKGTYMSAARYVKHTFATTNSGTLRKRVEQFMDKSGCTVCQGKRLKPEALSVKFAGYDIAELSRLPLTELAAVLAAAPELASGAKSNPDQKQKAAALIVHELLERIELLDELGLAYLSMERSAPSLSSGELQRLRLTNLLSSGLFGVVYVLDEPSAGLHPRDSEALFRMLVRLKESGNSLFVVEHEMELVRKADWLVDIGPQAGDGGGSLLFSGPVQALKEVPSSLTRQYLFPLDKAAPHVVRKSKGSLTIAGINCHNLHDLTVTFPTGVLTAVTGVSGSGKSTLVSRVLSEAMRAHLGESGSNEEGQDGKAGDEEDGEQYSDIYELGSELAVTVTLSGEACLERLVLVEQKPIGRTPRSNLATYTGLFDHVRKAFTATAEAKEKGFNAGRFSFNVKGGRCDNCEGEGFVNLELMFLPSVYAPCSVCQGRRYNEETLSVRYKGLNVAEVLELTVDAALSFFQSMPPIRRALSALQEVGLGYLRLGQAATELSGGEAQRIRLATELQREQKGKTLYILDEPTTGLHPHDVEKLLQQFNTLVDCGNTVVVVEHDMDIVSRCDHIIELGPGAGASGGKIVASGSPAVVARADSATAPYLRRRLS